jgi:hypothetical protein
VLVLVHSPLVGPGIWAGLVPLLARRGYDAAVPDLTGTLTAGPPYASRQVAVIAGCAGTGAVLVGHSGAGALLGPAARELGEVRGCVFLDAGLPIPGRTQLSTMPAELADQLRAMTDPDGWLPPWPQWWGEDVLAELIPDAQVRRGFAAGCPRIPMAMFEEALPDGSVGVAAYLRLSEAYDEPAAQARSRGWPVTWLDRHHLAPLTDPGPVADALIELLAAANLTATTEV